MRRYLCTLALCLLAAPVPALTITNPNYQAEVYVSYVTSNYGPSHDFCFGPGGEIYVTHHTTRFQQDGSIVKVDILKNDSIFVPDMWSPMEIKYGNGGSFGNHLYVTDADNRTYYNNGEVTQIDFNGNTSSFAGNVDQPSGLGIDHVGNYENKMYIANSAHDQIMEVGPNGGNASTFSIFWEERIGSIRTFEFDPGTRYGGKMYSAGTYQNQDYSGVFQIETDGSALKYYEIASAAGLLIDKPGGLFDGGMFFTGAFENELWKLYKVNGIDDADSIATFDAFWTKIHLGPDGAMYAMEWNDITQETIITKITPVPEPIGTVLLGLGLFFARKRR